MNDGDLECAVELLSEHSNAVVKKGDAVVLHRMKVAEWNLQRKLSTSLLSTAPRNDKTKSR